MPDDASKPKPMRVTKRKAAGASAWVLAEFGSNQGIKLIRSILLTRLISQQLFGIVGMANIVVAFVAAFSDFGGNIAIMRERRVNERPFLNTAWTLSVLRGLAVWLVICGVAYPASRIYEEPALLIVIPLLGITAFLASANSTKIATMNRDLLMGRVVTIKFLTRVIGLIATISWALIAPDHLGVIIVGPVLAAMLMLIASWLLLPGPNNGFAWDRKALGELIRFGRWLFLSTLLTFFIRKGDVMIVGKLLATEQFAVYSIAYMAADFTPSVFRALNGRVVFPVYANIQTTSIKLIRRRIFKMRAMLMSVFLPLTWLIMFFGSFVIELAYPDSYSEAGWMLELYAAGSIGLLIAMSSGGILLAKGDSLNFMLIRVVRGALMLVGMVVGFHLGDGQLLQVLNLVRSLGTDGGPDFATAIQWFIDFAHPDPMGGLRGFIVGMGVSYWVSYAHIAWAVRRHGTWLPGLDAIAFGLSALMVVLRFGILA